MRACYALLTSAVGFGHESGGPKMVEVPGGTFTMGSATELSAPIASNQPAHTVTVSDFLMSKYEVTNQEFADYLNDAEVLGQVEVRDDLPGVSGEFVVAADGQTYAGQKMYELSGTNQDGESELNRPWIQYDDGAALGKRFAVVDSQDVFGNNGPSTVYTCNTRLKRGGSWNFHEPTLRSEARNTDYVFRGNDHFGFRIVQSASKPDRPLKLQATVKSSSRIRLDWQDKSDNESAFEVQYKTVPGKWQSMETGANVDNLTIGGLSAGTSHKFRVRARNASGTSRWSNRVRAKTDS